jgi:hypothetical protein
VEPPHFQPHRSRANAECCRTDSHGASLARFVALVAQRRQKFEIARGRQTRHTPNDNQAGRASNHSAGHSPGCNNALDYACSHRKNFHDEDKEPVSERILVRVR